jgi:hypothetical protein
MRLLYVNLAENSELLALLVPKLIRSNEIKILNLHFFFFLEGVNAEIDSNPEKVVARGYGKLYM